MRNAGDLFDRLSHGGAAAAASGRLKVQNSFGTNFQFCGRLLCLPVGFCKIEFLQPLLLTKKYAHPKPTDGDSSEAKI
jgi:hypothetical protein